MEKTERKKDGSYWFTMTIKAIPEPTNIQWSMKENNEKAFELLNINDEEYKGSTDAFPHPVLVVKSSKYEKYKFQIEVKNFTGNSEFMIQGRLKIIFLLMIYDVDTLTIEIGQFFLKFHNFLCFKTPMYKVYTYETNKRYS